MNINKIADIIERHNTEIVNEWVKAVRETLSFGASSDLSDGGLRDHVPQVLEEIAALLRTGDIPGILNTREARVSAYTRYTQNYRISELVTEIAILRRSIFNRLQTTLISRPSEINLSEYARSADTINAYLDEEMRYGSSIFCESIKKYN